MDEKIINLPQQDLPKKWFNVNSEIGQILSPPMNPVTGKVLQPSELEAIFPPSLIEQEISAETWIDVPEPIIDVWRMWRPTPLVRADRLEKALGTPAKIYYKNESVSPPGSHKPNTAVAQVYYNKEAGIKRLATETGAGQWGSALCFATNLFGLECTVYMVRISFEQKPYRKSLMRIWKGTVYPSPSDKTEAGRSVLKEAPDTPGSLGIAISEAVEDAATHNDTNYSLGSVLGHVTLHQTVVGLEVKKQLEMVGDKPDIMIGCCGGGSNFAGFFFPYVPEKMAGENIRFIGVEPTACPTMTKGLYTYDYGDTAKMTPLLKMYTLGHDFIPPGIHAGGLRYHGMNPQISAMVKEGIVEAVSFPQVGCYEAALLFARTEGIVPAPETSHAIKCAVDEALKCKEEGREKTIVFNFSGHGHFDMTGYEAFLDGKLVDFHYPEEKIKESMARLPKIGAEEG